MFFIHEILPVCKHIGIEIDDCIFSSRQGQDRVNNIDIWMNNIEKKQRIMEYCCAQYTYNISFSLCICIQYQIVWLLCNTQCVLYFYQPISQLLQLIACVGRAGYTVTMTISITIITNTITKIITINIYETSSASSSLHDFFQQPYYLRICPSHPH